MKIKRYFSAKTKQLKHLSWFLAGFAFGTGYLMIAIIAVVLALLFDFLYYVITPERKKDGGA